MNQKTFLSRMGLVAGRCLSVIFFLLPLGYMLLSLGILDLLTRNSYGSLLDWYQRAFPGAFYREAIAEQSFTLEWHQWLVAHQAAGTVVLAAMPLIYLVFSRPIWRFSVRLAAELRGAMAFLWRGLYGCSASEKAGVLLLLSGVLAYRLYFYFSLPLQMDELCSYLYFVRPGFFISITSYPIPNNHVFFNACCALLNLVPGLSIKAVMRLPVIAGDLFLLYGIFCLCRRWDGYQRALVTVAGVAFCYLTSFYAVQGRGYQWQLVCVVVSAFSCWECFRGAGKGERRGYALFIISCVVGFYISPVFLYPFITLMLVCLYYFIRGRANGDMLFLGGCVGVIVGALLVLYLPVILASSWSAVTANEYVTGTSYEKLFSHFRDMAFVVKDITYYDLPGLCFMLVCAGALWMAYRKRMFGGVFYDHMLIYLIAVPVCLAIWTLYKRVYPIERSLCFWVLALNVVFVNACYDLSRVFFSRGWRWLVAVFLLIKVAGSVRGLYWERWNIGNLSEVRIGEGVRKDIRELDKLRPTSWQLTDSDDYFAMCLQEYLIGKGEEDEVFLSRTGVLGDVIFLPESRRLLFPLEGYTLWGGEKITSHGRALRIYVLKRLGEKNKNF